jgi:8-oxo-dGTP pyrophosphatase MutT (NUDIX family)
MVSQGKGWVLPGGYPEPGESLDDALIREIAEEACATVLEYQYIGSIRTYELPPIAEGNLPLFYQARYWVRAELGPFIPDFEMTQRIEVAPEELVDLLRWNAKQTARLMLNDALARELASRSNPAGSGTCRGVEEIDRSPPGADCAI